MTKEVVKFDALQVESIIEKVVNLVAAEEDKEFFRGILYIRAEESTSSADFSNFVARLLKTHFNK